MSSLLLTEMARGMWLALKYFFDKKVTVYTPTYAPLPALPLPSMLIKKSMADSDGITETSLRDLRDDIPVIWEKNFGFPSLQEYLT